MGVISSELVHLLKVKLSLQNDQRWLLLLSWFSKFSGGGPLYPPSTLEYRWHLFIYFFKSTGLITGPFVKTKSSTRVKTHVCNPPPFDL